MRIFGNADLDNERAQAQAEARFCEMRCGQVCAALEFNERQCGKEPETTFDPSRPQSHYYCETPDGKSLPRNGFFTTIRALVSPSYSGTVSSISSIIQMTNDILARNECPLHFRTDNEVHEMPLVFERLQINDASALKAFAQYPGTVKFVNEIGYCGSNPSSLTLDGNGQEVIKECIIPDYF